MSWSMHNQQYITTSEVLVGSDSCNTRCDVSHGMHHVAKFSRPSPSFVDGSSLQCISKIDRRRENAWYQGCVRQRIFWAHGMTVVYAHRLHAALEPSASITCV